MWKASLGGMYCGRETILAYEEGDSKGVSSELVKEVSASLRKIGCRCVIDEQVRKTCKSRVISTLC